MSGFLKAVASAPPRAVQEFLGSRPLCILAPHPDDETLGCGALLFDADRLNVACHVICVTDGSRSHPNSQSWSAERLAATRKAELEAALNHLVRVPKLTWLGYPDCRAPDDAVTARDISQFVPRNALLLATWEGDPHIDHRRVARLAAHIARARPDTELWFYPIWGRFSDCAPRSVLTLGASEEALAAKIRAVGCHRTQMSRLINDDPDGFMMEEWRQQHFQQQPEIIIAA